MPIEPFAIYIYREHLRGKTIQQLAEEFEIPDERIERRIRAAAQYAATRGGTRFPLSRLPFKPLASGI